MALFSDTPALEQIFVGDSDMARQMRQFDWTRTNLGDPTQWPQALKSAVRILLTSKFEMWLGWGPDIAFLYNDAYRPTLGKKHPKSLAMPTRVLWSEIWQDVEPRVRHVYETGQATWDRALLLMLNRHGYPEETYHTFSYSPLVGDTEKVEGIFCAVTEETDRVISVRRLASLEALASTTTGADQVDGLFQCVAASARSADRDMLFCAAYGFDTQGQVTPFFEDLDTEPLHNPVDQWELASIWNGVSLLTVDVSLHGIARSGAWPAGSVQRAAVVGLSLTGRDRPVGALVIGLNPFRPFDDDYRSYVKLLAGQIVARWAGIEALDSERQRATALDEALALRQQAAQALARLNQQLTTEVRATAGQRDRLRAMFKQAPSFMALLSGPDHVFELANDAYMNLVGHQREVIGLPVRQALPEVEGQGYFEILDQVFATGQTFVGEALSVKLNRMEDGEPQERFVHLVYQPLLMDGKVDGIFVDGYDITHQKRAEDALRQLNTTLEEHVQARTAELAQALDKLQKETAEHSQAQRALQRAQKMEALGALTGGVAHDFNNLLQVISANLQLLGKMNDGNAPAMKRIESALNGVARGAKLASQLLSFGRRQPLEPKVVNVGRLARGMEDMLRRALGEGVEVEMVVSAGLWNTFVDPGQIENAILNLAINARDAMEGRGKLTIEAGNALLDADYAARHDDVVPGQYVMIAVSDTGSGMPQDVMEKAFEPFFSTKAEGKGTGLGLSMVYGFVKQSGGHVMIYSEVGEGTTLRLYLPRSMKAEDVLSSSYGAGPVEGGSETILVVEDDEEVRDSVVAMLSDLGYRILKAKNADSALTVIDSGVHIDLLFTDVVMPGKLRSPELARKAVQRLPGIGVLFTSGYTENSIVHGGRLDDGVELLTKPYTREALARRVRHVLSNRAQVRHGALDAARHPAAQPAAVPDGRRAALPELSILLVEDEASIRATTAESLREAGHRVAEAGSAREALQSLQSVQALSPHHAFDVLVVDQGLPDMDGIELACNALQIAPQVQVVFATGALLNLPAALANARLVLKPYSVANLIAVIAAISGSR